VWVQFSFGLKSSLADPCATICSKLLTARFCRENAHEKRSLALQRLAAPKKSEGRRPLDWTAAPEAFPVSWRKRHKLFSGAALSLSAGTGLLGDCHATRLVLGFSWNTKIE